MDARKLTASVRRLRHSCHIRSSRTGSRRTVLQALGGPGRDSVHQRRRVRTGAARAPCPGRRGGRTSAGGLWTTAGAGSRPNPVRGVQSRRALAVAVAGGAASDSRVSCAVPERPVKSPLQRWSWRGQGGRPAPRPQVGDRVRRGEGTPLVRPANGPVPRGRVDSLSAVAPGRADSCARTTGYPKPSPGCGGRMGPGDREPKGHSDVRLVPVEDAAEAVKGVRPIYEGLRAALGELPDPCPTVALPARNRTPRGRPAAFSACSSDWPPVVQPGHCPAYAQLRPAPPRTWSSSPPTGPGDGSATGCRTVCFRDDRARSATMSGQVSCRSVLHTGRGPAALEAVEEGVQREVEAGLVILGGAES